ncbi:MAG: YdcF family protein [Lachnospiraceae bacterium]|nr:YdcF family protein [Lachnospiraceae bacterium]
MAKRKPKVWNIAVVTGLALAIGIALVFLKADALYAFILADVYYCAVIVLLVRAFFAQIRYNIYSYNTIIYSGFALLFVFLLTAGVSKTVQTAWDPGVYGPEEALFVLAGIPQVFMLLTAPLVLVFAIALCISNIVLILREGKRLVNFLGILLSVLLVGGEVLMYAVDYYVSGSEAEVMRHDLIVNPLAAAYLYFECMLIGTCIANIVAVRREPEKDRDAVVILGCGIRKDGTCSPLLKGRIDRALRFRKDQLEKTGKDLIFVTSGGQGPNEVRSESAAMKDYLIGQGIPEERILEEDRSTSTFENMKFSKKILDDVCPGGKYAFSTTNYHVFRSGIFSYRTKLKADGMGIRTRWYFWPNASVREFIGLLTEHRGKQALILAGMVVLQIVLTRLSYR